MEDSVTIDEIVDAEAKSGVSQKTGKPWSQARVGLSNGESTFIFNPVQVGDKVVKVQRGEYTNWQVVKADPRHEEIMIMLNKIYNAVSKQDLEL